MNDQRSPLQALLVWLNTFIPGLKAFRHYQIPWLRHDLTAGLSVAAVALPVGIAYADLAGVPPIYGMYSAIFPLFAYALFGSSKQLMTGPDAATCIIVAASLGPLSGGDPEKYLALMVVLTLTMGVLFILAGIGKLGFIANFFSQPILTGYLNGIAALIVVGQLPKLFGYTGGADSFIEKLIEIPLLIGQSHLPTVVLGIAMLILLVLLRRLLPKSPSALIVVIAGIIAVFVFALDTRGVAVLGEVPTGLPSFNLSVFDWQTYRNILLDGSGIVLVSFTSGILTAKSFARRNRYDVNANQELVAFGTCNIASGLAHGFPVTGADSRTAVNDAMGGKTQLVGIVAAVTMLLAILLLAGPLSAVPIAALAAVIIVSGVGLFDFQALRELHAASHRELMFSIATTLGVLILGVLPGVVMAIGLSLLWLLTAVSRPQDAILGKVPKMKGFHNIADYPEAKTIPGLVIYQFKGNLMFFSADYFRERVRRAIAESPTPVEWVVVDASPVNIVDFTSIQKLDELREELQAKGVVLAYARVKQSLASFFKPEWAKYRGKLHEDTRYSTLNAAILAFQKHQKSNSDKVTRAADPSEPARPKGEEAAD